MISQVIFLAAVASLAAASGILPVAYNVQPYNFGYDIKDALSQQYRQESGNGAGGVTGSYGFTDARGILRQVNYVADGLGFRAAIRTNEPGTANQNPAAVGIISDAPYAGRVATLGGAGLGYGGLADGRLGLVGPYGYNGLGLGYGLNGVRSGLGYGLNGVRSGLLGDLGYLRYGY